MWDWLNEFIDTGTDAAATAYDAASGWGQDLLQGTTDWGSTALGNFSDIASGMSADQFADFAAGGSSGGGVSDTFGWLPSARTMADVSKWANPAMSLISGGMGIYQQNNLRSKAAAMDPWGQSGGRGLADQQLQAFMKDPSQAAATDPAYKLRMQGAQRANAQYGQDSGAMSVAGANASTDWYNQRLAQLGGLAGAPGNPAAPMAGYTAANDLLGKSLGSIGYAAAPSSSMSPELQAELKRLIGGANGG